MRARPRMRRLADEELMGLVATPEAGAYEVICDRHATPSTAACGRLERAAEEGDVLV